MFIKSKLLLIIFFVSKVAFTFNDTSYVIGYDKIEKIIDGDTFRLSKFKSAFRLMCIDTEETFKGKNAETKTEDISKRWKEYYSDNKSNEKYNKPSKIESPFGYKTVIWAKEYLNNIDSIRIELDNFDRVYDMYGRELVYIIVYKQGKEINYNIECVREGYSPYFNKYGNSSRFHNEFIDAQNEAIKHKKGIWSNNEKCYPDYSERLEWWNYRANQLINYEEKYSGNPDYLNLMNDNNKNILEPFVGKDIIIFADIGDFFLNKFPYLFRVSITRNLYLDILIYEENNDIIEKLNLNNLDKYFVYVRGVIFKNRENYFMKLRIENDIWIE